MVSLGVADLPRPSRSQLGRNSQNTIRYSLSSPVRGRMGAVFHFCAKLSVGWYPWVMSGLSKLPCLLYCGSDKAASSAAESPNGKGKHDSRVHWCRPKNGINRMQESIAFGTRYSAWMSILYDTVFLWPLKKRERWSGIINSFFFNVKKSLSGRQKQSSLFPHFDINSQEGVHSSLT